MVGMNDGAMPQPVSSSSLITDEEKKVFEQQAQVELSPTSDILQMDEAFVCYIAMTRGSEQVTFSYSLRLNERTKYKLENFDLGNIFHTALKYISDKVD